MRRNFEGESFYSSRFSKYGGHLSQIDRFAKTTHKDIANSSSDMVAKLFHEALWIGDCLFDEPLCLGLCEGGLHVTRQSNDSNTVWMFL